MVDYSKWDKLDYGDDDDSDGDEECGTIQVFGSQATITWPDDEDGSCMKFTMVYDLQ